MKKTTKKFADLQGKRFGKLTVIRQVFSEKLQHRVWECKCDCGNLKEIQSTNLTSGRQVSCGCVRNTNALTLNKSHGETKEPLYKRWLAMRNRCKHNKKYYVDRGITVCKQWEDYLQFKRDMGDSFIEHSSIYGERNTTLERVDSNKGYYLGNCKWATQMEQAQNLRKPFKITNYEKLELFINEFNKLKGTEFSVSEAEFLLLSYYIRKNKKNNKTV